MPAFSAKVFNWVTYFRIIDKRIIDLSFQRNDVNKGLQIYRSIDVKDFDAICKYARNRECSYREYIMTSLSEYSNTTKVQYRFCLLGTLLVAFVPLCDYLKGVNERVSTFLFLREKERDDTTRAFYSNL